MLSEVLPSGGTSVGVGHCVGASVGASVGAFVTASVGVTVTVAGTDTTPAVGVTTVGTSEGLCFVSLPQEERTIIKTVIIPTIPIRFICSTPFSSFYLLVA